jgi:hypothetical protein
VTLLIVLVVVVVVVVVAVSVTVPLLIRRADSSMAQEVSGLAHGQSGADTIRQHSGELSQLEGMAGRFSIHLDLADDLGTKVAGTGMQQPTQGTMHVVGRSAPDPKDMRGPCTIAYAIEAPGVAAVSGEQILEGVYRAVAGAGRDAPPVSTTLRPPPTRHRVAAGAELGGTDTRRRPGPGHRAQPATAPTGHQHEGNRHTVTR